MGYVADNRWMGLCLVRELLDTNVQWQAPASVTNMTPLSDGVSIELQTEGGLSTITAQCLVVADGGRSGLRETLGFQSRSHNYGQSADRKSTRLNSSHVRI